MKAFIHCFIVITLVLTIPIFGQNKPRINFEDLIISSEKDVQQVFDARKLTELYNIPYSIYLSEGIFIDAKGIEDDKVVYTIINNLRDVYDNGETAYWDEIVRRFDLSGARIHWTNKPTQNPELGFEITKQQNSLDGFLMVTQSTTAGAGVMTFNSFDGTLINQYFITGSFPNLNQPFQALLTSNATILVTERQYDRIVEFDTLGIFSRVFFGYNTNILNNPRGIKLRPSVNSVVVAATIDSLNAGAIAEFDVTTGNFLGNFIPPSITPIRWFGDIIFRSADCLLSDHLNNAILKYDLNGIYSGVFVPSIVVPYQLHETSNGNILAAGFNNPSGLYIYDTNGNQVNYFNSVTGLYGAYQLDNGNYMVTNSAGVFVLNQVNGNVVSQPVSGVTARYVSKFDRSIIPVELMSFTASVVGRSIILNWTTATEINNAGFEVQRKNSEIDDFETLSFVSGRGTTTEVSFYSYTDQNITSGHYTYRLKQTDYDGSISYSHLIEVEMTSPNKFALAQNYPNPFNPVTVINYSLPHKEHVFIAVYNLLGERVATLVNEVKDAGQYEIIFDASQFTSGTYFYKLVSGSKAVVKKMILMK